MQKFLSILLTSLLLISSAGVTYAQHLCGGQVVADAFMIGEKLLSCDKAEADKYISHQKAMPDCCVSVYNQVVTDDNFSVNSFNFQLDTTFAAAFVSVFILKKEVFFSEKEVKFSTYLPPPDYKDILVLYQEFLI